MEYNGPVFNKNKKQFITNDQKAGNGFKKVTLCYTIDGDTAVFLIDKKEVKVRFLAIDTPEIKPVNKPFSLSAKEYTNYVLSKANEIYLQTDSAVDLLDDTPSKRLLAWVWADQELLNYNLVENGYALIKYVHSNKLMYLKDLYNAEEYAKNNKLRLYEVEENVING